MSPSEATTGADLISLHEDPTIRPKVLSRVFSSLEQHPENDVNDAVIAALGSLGVCFTEEIVQAHVDDWKRIASKIDANKRKNFTLLVSPGGRFELVKHEASPRLGRSHQDESRSWGVTYRHSENLGWAFPNEIQDHGFFRNFTRDEASKIVETLNKQYEHGYLDISMITFDADELIRISLSS